MSVDPGAGAPTDPAARLAQIRALAAAAVSEGDVERLHWLLMTDLADVVDALDAVLALHQPTSEIVADCEDYPGCDATVERPCDDAGEHLLPSCGECRMWSPDWEQAEYLWPCPTVKAITARLHRLGLTDCQEEH